MALAGTIAVLVAAFLVVDDRPGAVPRPISAPTAGPALPPSELAGRWSGTGSLTDCAGFDDGGCPRTASFTLTISCSRQPCTVTAENRGAGSPPLTFEDGRYRAAGPVRAEIAPTCVGAPSSSAQWRLDLVVSDGRLVGSYQESTGQTLNCGATSVEWSVTLDRT